MGRYHPPEVSTPPMINPDWKTTLLASFISSTIVFSLGYLYLWAVGV